MEELRRVRVHRADSPMPSGVRVWIEPTGTHHVDVYVCAELISEQEAKQLETDLNSRRTEGGADGGRAA